MRSRESESGKFFGGVESLSRKETITSLPRPDIKNCDIVTVTIHLRLLCKHWNGSRLNAMTGNFEKINKMITQKSVMSYLLLCM